MPEPRTEDRCAELVAEDGRSLPLVSAALRVEAGGGLARAVVEQTFTNDSDDVLSVTYKMPLPADGAVSGYAFSIGERTIAGRVDPNAVARERFEDAIARGQTAAILEQDRMDIFTQQIGNIPPRSRIVARVTVDQRLAWLPEGEWELRFPTVIGPRYVGAGAPEADAKAVAIEVAHAVRARLALEVCVRDALAPGRAVESPSHRLHQEGGGAGVTVVQLAALEGARLDRDVVVRWSAAKPQVGVSITTARAAGEERVYALLTIVPPAPEARVATTPRDLIVLVDTSGSMGGTPLEQAKRVVARLVGSLSTEDRLELIAFSNAPRAWRKQPAPATDAAKKDALAWLGELQASGGTEMQTAVLAALSSLRPRAQRQVVLVTDGYIGGEREIVETLHDRLPDACRMHFVGVGAAPNRSLATSMARAGRGAEILLGLTEDPERAVSRLLARTAAPVLTDVTITGAIVTAQAPARAPDVFSGSPVLAALELSPEGGDVFVQGRLGGGTWRQRVRVPAIQEGEGAQAVRALFARERVADLDVEWTMDRDVASVDAEIERIGVDFQIATRMTSWVAIDERRSVDPYAPSRSETVPQELPYGTSMESFGLGALGGALPAVAQAALGASFELARSASAPAAMPASIAARAGGRAPRREGEGGAERAYGGAPPPPTGAPMARRARATDAAPPLSAAPRRARSVAASLALLFVLLALALLIVWFFFLR